MSKSDEITFTEALLHIRPGESLYEALLGAAMSKSDEITLKEAAEYVKAPTPTAAEDPGPGRHVVGKSVPRERETGEASAGLDAMLAASRRGKRVTG